MHDIVGRTNIDAVWEGVYVPSNDDHDGIWTVTFDDAEFGLIEPYDYVNGNMKLLWDGTLSFTINITRTLV